MNRSRMRARMSFGLALILCAGLLAVPLSLLLNKHLWARGVLEEVEPRYARLLGLEEMADRIERARVQAEGVLAEQAYPASLDADRAGADLQQRLRAAAQQAGLSIQGSQIVAAPPPVAREGTPPEPFERIIVNINFEADLPALQGMLDALRQQRPAIHVESLGIQPVRGANAGQRLNVQARLIAFRVIE